MRHSDDCFTWNFLYLGRFLFILAHFQANQHPIYRFLAFSPAFSALLPVFSDVMSGFAALSRAFTTLFPFYQLYYPVFPTFAGFPDVLLDYATFSPAFTVFPSFTAVSSVFCHFITRFFCPFACYLLLFCWFCCFNSHFLLLFCEFLPLYYPFFSACYFFKQYFRLFTSFRQILVSFSSIPRPLIPFHLFCSGYSHVVSLHTSLARSQVLSLSSHDYQENCANFAFLHVFHVKHTTFFANIP